jgi:hypothetical protein
VRIAQRFNVGLGSRRPTSPEGTTEPGCKSSAVPSGLVDISTPNPTLKRWAILKNPSGMGSQILVTSD